MSCGSSTFEVTRAVWSTGDGNELFHEFLRVKTDPYARVRITQISEANTDDDEEGNMLIVAGGIYFNIEDDLTSSPTVTSLGGLGVRGDGVRYPSTWTDLDADARYLCLGVSTSNPKYQVPDTDHERALVTLLIEFQS